MVGSPQHLDLNVMESPRDYMKKQANYNKTPRCLIGLKQQKSSLLRLYIMQIPRLVLKHMLYIPAYNYLLDWKCALLNTCLRCNISSSPIMRETCVENCVGKESASVKGKVVGVEGWAVTNEKVFMGKEEGWNYAGLVKQFCKTCDHATSAFNNCCGNAKENMSTKKIRDK